MTGVTNYLFFKQRERAFAARVGQALLPVLGGSIETPGNTDESQQ